MQPTSLKRHTHSPRATLIAIKRRTCRHVSSKEKDTTAEDSFADLGKPIDCSNEQTNTCKLDTLYIDRTINCLNEHPRQLDLTTIRNSNLRLVLFDSSPVPTCRASSRSSFFPFDRLNQPNTHTHTHARTQRQYVHVRVCSVTSVHRTRARVRIHTCTCYSWTTERRKEPPFAPGPRRVYLLYLLLAWRILSFFLSFFFFTLRAD